MSTPPLRVSRDDYNDVRSSIENAISLGGDIRGILESQKESEQRPIFDAIGYGLRELFEWPLNHPHASQAA